MYLLIGALSLFTFKVIIAKYVPIAISLHFIVFWLFLFFFVPSFFSSLSLWFDDYFSVIFGSLSFVCVCVYVL